MSKKINKSDRKLCPHCGKAKYGSNTDWLHHMKRCERFYGKYGKDPKCPVCKAGIKKFKSKIAFLIHVNWCKGVMNFPTENKHKEISDKSHTCKVCHKSFKSCEALGGHMNSHRISPDRINDECPRCGRRASEFKWYKSFKLHVGKCTGMKKEGGFKCGECDKKFDSSAALRGHKWIHGKPQPGKEWGDKDKVRAGLQQIAATHLCRLPMSERVAICLPGSRPQNEEKLMSDPGFSKVYMAEIKEDKAKAAVAAGFDVRNEDFIDLALDLTSKGTRLSMIDYDICGTVTYADGSALLSIVRNRGITDIACIRVTSCRRSWRKSGEYDVEAFGRDLEFSVPKDFHIASKASSIYVGKDRSSMMVEQWVLKRGA